MFLKVLGCGSATPTTLRSPSAFVLTFSNRKDAFLIDCSEGTQLRMRAQGIRMQNISHIFISHLHGDHCYGLMGFLSTQSLLGRKDPIHLYAHKPLRKLINMQLKIDHTRLTFPLVFHVIKDRKRAIMLLEEPNLEVIAFPLLHSILTHGFVFKERLKEKQILPSFLEKHNLSKQQKEKISKGQNYRTPEGEVFKNKDITFEKELTKTFAYCSDTAYTESIIPYIENADLLYHEATFMENLSEVAAQKGHSTAKQAATIALKANVERLLIGHYSARYTDLTPLLNEAQQVFPNTVAAQEGRTEQI